MLFIAHLLSAMRKAECVIVRDVKKDDRVVRVGDTWSVCSYNLVITGFFDEEDGRRFASCRDNAKCILLDESGQPVYPCWTLASRAPSPRSSRKPRLNEKWIFNSLGPEWTVSRVDADKVTFYRAAERPSSSNMEIIVQYDHDGSMPPQWSRVESKVQQRTKVSEWWEVHTRHATDTGPWTPIYRENKRSTIVERFKQRKLFSPKDMDSRIVHVVRYALVKG